MNRGQSLNRPPQSLRNNNLKESSENYIVTVENSPNFNSNNELGSLHQNRRPGITARSRIGRFATTLGQGIRGIRNRISNRFRQPERNLEPSKRHKRNWLNNKKIMNNTKSIRNRIYQEKQVERIKQLKMMIGFTEEQSQNKFKFGDMCTKFIQTDYSYKKEFALLEAFKMIREKFGEIKIQLEIVQFENAMKFVPNIIKYLDVDRTYIYYEITGEYIFLSSTPRDDLTKINIVPSETSTINPNGHFEESYENFAYEKIGITTPRLYITYNYIPNGHLKGNIYIPYRSVKNAINVTFLEVLGNTDNKYLINDENDGNLYYMLHGIRYNLIIIKNINSSNSLDKISSDKISSDEINKAALKDIGFNDNDLITRISSEQIKNKFLDINILESDKLEFAFTHYERINNAFIRMYSNKDKEIVNNYISQRRAKLEDEALRLIGFNDDEVIKILEMNKMSEVVERFLQVNEHSINSTLLESAFTYILSKTYEQIHILEKIKERQMKIEQIKSKTGTSTNVQKKHNLNKLVKGENKINRKSRRQINL